MMIFSKKKQSRGKFSMNIFFYLFYVFLFCFPLNIYIVNWKIWGKAYLKQPGIYFKQN